VPENPRIDQLRRRVSADPASVAFAALAEEYRKEGRYPEAIETCRVGLQRHPAYLSARVTLGRALLGVGDYEAARLELEAVLRLAPENLAAIRAMADIYSRLRDADEMPAEEADSLPDAEPAGEETHPVEPVPPPSVDSRRAPLAVVPFEPAPRRNDAPIARLERFLDAIAAARARLANGASDPRAE
jgi:tetratricopeptide (TPR) repeat protein